MNNKRTQISPKKLSSLGVIVCCVVVIGIGFHQWIASVGATRVQLGQTITIPKGSGSQNLPEILKVNANPLRLKLWLRFFSPDITLKSGTYLVPTDVNTLNEAFAMLRNPTPAEAEIMILPGWHKGEISEEFLKHGIEGNLLATEGKLIEKFSDTYAFLRGKSSLEGFLMPDTYRIAGGTDVTTIVGKMLENFNNKIALPYIKTGKSPNAFYDVLTLASIVGEEEKSPSQIDTVAQILKKRLRSGWHIGADITVCYPDLIPGSSCQKFVNGYYGLSQNIRKEQNNLYDTRENIGLPPTPIASITADTFFATLNASIDTSAWYYLHDSQGVIHTASTEAEHEENKAQFLH